MFTRAVGNADSWIRRQFAGETLAPAGRRVTLAAGATPGRLRLQTEAVCVGDAVRRRPTKGGGG